MITRIAMPASYSSSSGSCRGWTGDAARPADVEAEELPVAHADARRTADKACRDLRGVAHRDRAAREVDVRERRRDAEGGAEEARTGQPGTLVESGDRLGAADEDRRPEPLRLGREVEAVVHAVDAIHVGEPGRTEHRVVPRRRSRAGVRGGLGADVRLDLDQARGLAVVGEDLAEEVAGDDERRPREERAG